MGKEIGRVDMFSGLAVRKLIYRVESANYGSVRCNSKLGGARAPDKRNMSTRSILKISIGCLNPSLRNQPFRCFSYSHLHAQKQAEQPQNGKTTHFGFQQVPESAKESKGP